MTRLRWLLAFALALPLNSCSDGQAQSPLVAKAADHELTVDEEARLLAPRSELPSQRDVAMALAELWVDYVLLATAAAEDSTFAQLDISPLMEQRAEQAVVSALRDSVIQVDTAIPDAELRRRFAQEGEASQVRARHILVTVDPEATEAERDSVRRGVQQLRTRIVEGGEDFASLAQTYSEDPGSAPQGGDLGFFGRGQMVDAFTDAAFSLEPGQVSEPVETRFGYHLIRVEERRTPTLDEFRQRLQQQRVTAAESAYIAGLEERTAPEITDDAVELVRLVARNPSAPLTGRAAGRDLVTYRGGAVTVDELRQYLQSRPPQYHAQVARAQDRQIEEGILRPLVRREILMGQARRDGWAVAPEQLEPVAAAARQTVKEAARQLGLLSIQAPAGQDRGGAIVETVRGLLDDIVSGRRNAVPLNAVSYILRQHYSAEIYENGIDRVVERVRELRQDGGSAPPAGGDESEGG